MSLKRERKKFYKTRRKLRLLLRDLDVTEALLLISRIKSTCKTKKTIANFLHQEYLILSAVDRPVEAIDVKARLLHLYPDDEQSWFELVNLHSGLFQISKSIFLIDRVLSEAFSVDFDRSEFYLLKAELLVEIDQFCHSLDVVTEYKELLSQKFILSRNLIAVQLLEAQSKYYIGSIGAAKNICKQSLACLQIKIRSKSKKSDTDSQAASIAELLAILGDSEFRCGNVNEAQDYYAGSQKYYNSSLNSQAELGEVYPAKLLIQERLGNVFLFREDFAGAEKNFFALMQGRSVQMRTSYGSLMSQMSFITSCTRFIYVLIFSSNHVNSVSAKEAERLIYEVGLTLEQLRENIYASDAQFVYFEVVFDFEAVQGLYHLSVGDEEKCQICFEKSLRIAKSIFDRKKDNSLFVERVTLLFIQYYILLKGSSFGGNVFCSNVQMRTFSPKDLELLFYSIKQQLNVIVRYDERNIGAVYLFRIIEKIISIGCKETSISNEDLVLYLSYCSGDNLYDVSMRFFLKHLKGALS